MRRPSAMRAGYGAGRDRWLRRCVFRLQTVTNPIPTITAATTNQLPVLGGGGQCTVPHDGLRHE